MSNTPEKVAIIGAGLVGSVMAIYLVRKGYQVSVYERRGDMRKGLKDNGRSINLALSNRGWRALEEIGVAGKVQKLVIPMKGRMMHDIKGNLTFQQYGKDGQYINSVSRSGLNEILLTEAEKAGVQTFFDHQCLKVDYEKSAISIATNGSKRTISADLIIGADGAFSAVRSELQKTYRFNYSQHFLEHGYKELEIPAKKGGGFSVEKHALHIWPRGKYMLIALPNLDGSFTCTLFFPFDGKPSFSSLNTEKDVTDFFRNTFPDALDLMPTLAQDFQNNPTSSLVTIKCYPWHKNRTLLIGDASHAIVPFYGQGMNAGFEDCRILNQLIESHSGNWDTILEDFQKARKPDADAISKLAIQNFIEMRDHVADEKFLVRKKIEAKLNELFPNKWIPLYAMVTFNDSIKYSEALLKGMEQRAIMDEVMQTQDIISNWESLDFKKIADKLSS